MIRQPRGFLERNWGTNLNNNSLGALSSLSEEVCRSPKTRKTMVIFVGTAMWDDRDQDFDVSHLWELTIRKVEIGQQTREIMLEEGSKLAVIINPCSPRVWERP